MPESAPIPQAIPCKICGGASPHFFRCDFHNQARMNFGLYSRDINPSGVMVDYMRCEGCGYVFTTFMDAWQAKQFSDFVYTRDYPRIDGSYNGTRGGGTANTLFLGFAESMNQLDFLDYGGGTGIQTALIRAFGAKRAETFDPFAANAQRPEGRFNIVTAMEVLEHATDPKKLAADLVDLTDLDNGFMMIGTEFAPEDFTQQKENWWYVAPRVGHVGFFTQAAMAALFAPHGVKFLHVEGRVHLGFKNWPIWAQQFMPAQMMG